jgi:acetylornithine deacetylase/succinyl-diaminopimelate desuccinylase-like protein
MLTPEPTGGVVWNANRGAISLRATMRGKAAHVGRQFEGVNAFERAMPAMARLLDIKKEVELRETQQNIAPAAARKSILMLGGRVEAGTNFNVTPDFCSFTIDRRINPEEDAKKKNAGWLKRWKASKSRPFRRRPRRQLRREIRSA